MNIRMNADTIIALTSAAGLLTFLSAALIADRRQTLMRRGRQQVWDRREKDNKPLMPLCCPAYLNYEGGFRVDCDLTYPHPGQAHTSRWAATSWVDEQIPT